MTEPSPTAGETWTVMEQGQAERWWLVVRDGWLYGLDGKGRLGDPFGSFISREWAQQTADFANDLEARLAAAEAALADSLWAAERWRKVEKGELYYWLNLEANGQRERAERAEAALLAAKEALESLDLAGKAMANIIHGSVAE